MQARSFRVLTASLLLFALATATAQTKVKKLTEWSKTDADAMLSDSPSAQTEIVGDTAQMFYSPASGARRVGTSRGAGPTITSVTPPSPRVGDLVVIGGSDLGSVTRPDGVAWVSLAPIAHPRGGNFQGASPSVPVPIVQWRDDRILVVMENVTPGEYWLAVRDRSPDDFARAAESNAVAVVVQPWQPTVPALRAGRRAINTSRVTRVHPQIALMRGQTLDVYGDFPFPDATTDEVLVRPVGPSWAAERAPMFHALRPTTVSKNHLSVRLPDNAYPAGEWAVTVRKRGGPEGTAGRFVLRALAPADWEYTSALRGSRPVPYRLVAAVGNVGLGGWYVDLLGYGFGSSKGTTGVWIISRELFDGIQSNTLSRGSEGALYAIPPSLDPIFWSETRIRVEVPHRPGEAPTPGVRFLLLSPDARRWSNVVSVNIR